MAVSGLIMLLYLVVHMIGNLKIFFGAGEFNGYAHWLRTVGEPFLHYEWYAVARPRRAASPPSSRTPSPRTSSAGATSRARPERRTCTSRPRASYATRTMRWGGIILGLFIVWHILDLTTGTVHSGGFQAGPPVPERRRHLLHLVRQRHLHRRDARRSACTSGTASGAPPRPSASAAAPATAPSRPSPTSSRCVLTAGFIAVPVAVMTGVVS